MDRRVDERFRKPRRAKGTAFFVQRNYYAAGALAVAGISWLLLELWPPARRLKQAQLEGKFDDPPIIQQRRQEIQLKLIQPSTASLVQKIKDRAWEKEEGDEERTEPKPWYVTMFDSKPEY